MTHVLRPIRDGWMLLLVPLVAVAMLAIAAVAGPMGLVAPAAALGLTVLLLNPGFTLGAMIVSTVLLEADQSGFLPATAKFYATIVGTRFTVPDILLLVLVVGVALDLARRREAPRLPGSFTLPLLLVAIGTLSGVLTGLASHGVSYNMFSTGRTFVYLAVLPFLVVNVLRSPESTQRMIVGAAVLVAFKGAEGTLAYMVGAGRTVGDASTLAYYEATTNWLILVFSLTLLTAFMLKRRISWWVWLSAPLGMAAFALSFRRGFWIGAALGVVMVLTLVGVRYTRRVGAVIAIAIIPVITVSVLVGTGVVSSQNPLVARIESISVAKVTSSVEDRYRIDEESNVVPQVVAHPMTGLGLGVAWRETERPVSIWFSDQFLYDHVTVIWWWLKLGIFGLVAYLALMGTLVVSAYRLWRLAQETLVRAIGMGVLAGTVGLLIAEQTNAATGVQFRLTVVLAVVIGWISAALTAERSRSGMEAGKRK